MGKNDLRVTFPGQPSIRAVVCRYDQYLGEPFKGVVVPSMVRAVAPASRSGSHINRTLRLPPVI